MPRKRADPATPTEDTTDKRCRHCCSSRYEKIYWSRFGKERYSESMSCDHPHAANYVFAPQCPYFEDRVTWLRDSLLDALLFQCQCRISEVIKLVVTDCDPVNGVLRIPQDMPLMKANCPSCNTRLRRRMRYCPDCGADIEEIVTSAARLARFREVRLDNHTVKNFQQYVERAYPPVATGRVFNLTYSQAQSLIKKRLANKSAKERSANAPEK